MEKTRKVRYLTGMRIRIFFSLMLFLLPSLLCAEVSVNVNVDRNIVGLGQTFIYQITVSGSGDVGNPSVNAPAGLQIVGQATSQQISMSGTSVSVTRTYTLTVQANQEGTFVWPPVTVSHQGQTFQSQPIEIKVVPASEAPPSPQQQNSPDPFGRDPFEEFFGTPRQQQQVYAVYTAVPNKTDVYVNEEFSVTYKLLVSGNVGIAQVGQPTEISGFWAEEPKMQTKNRRWTVEGKQVRDGIEFQVVPVLKQSYFPLSSGKKKIGSASIQVGVDTFFGMADGKVLKSDPVMINVLPLPEPKPQGFSGNTGRYSMTAVADKRNVKQNEAISVKVTVSGVGNIKSIAEPRKPDLSSFKIYSTTSSHSLDAESAKVSGKKVFEYVLVPLQAGKLKVGSFTYIFFDPVEKKYKSLRTPELQIDVEAVSEKERSNIVYATGSEVEAITSDIRYIKPRSLPKKSVRLSESTLFKIFLALEALALVGLFAWEIYQKTPAGEKKHGRQGRAFLVLRRDLEKLAQKGAGLGAEGVVSHAEKILYDYLAVRFNLPKSELNLDAILGYLRKMRISEEMLGSLREVMEEIHMYRYAPAGKKSDAERVKTLSDSLLATVTGIENYLRAKP